MVSLLGAFFFYIYIFWKQAPEFSNVCLMWFHYFAVTFQFCVLSAHLFSWPLQPVYFYNQSGPLPVLFLFLFPLLISAECSIFIYLFIFHLILNLQSKSVVKRRRKLPQNPYLARTFCRVTWLEKCRRTDKIPSVTLYTFSWHFLYDQKSKGWGEKAGRGVEAVFLTTLQRMHDFRFVLETSLSPCCTLLLASLCSSRWFILDTYQFYFFGIKLPCKYFKNIIL